MLAFDLPGLCATDIVRILPLRDSTPLACGLEIVGMPVAPIARTHERYSMARISLRAVARAASG